MFAKIGFLFRFAIRFQFAPRQPGIVRHRLRAAAAMAGQRLAEKREQIARSFLLIENGFG
jgi:hypothetical protein